jgi:hypothetical protein
MKYKISRNSFYDDNIKRIDILDDRFYCDTEFPDLFYPSTTTVLDVYPKGPALTEWHKALGFNADIVLQKAGITGSNVHDACHKYVNGHKIEFGQVIEGKFVANYSFEEWKMIVKFVEFWTEYNPELIASEVTLISHTHKVGGTADIIFRLMNPEGQFETWLLDTKSGNSVYPSHELQIATYATIWNEHNPDHFISRCGILHLQALTRGKDKQGKKIQGKGWQIVEFDRHYADAFKVFKHLKAVWDDANPDYKPKTYSLPGSLQLGTG